MGTYITPKAKGKSCSAGLPTTASAALLAWAASLIFKKKKPRSGKKS